MVEGKFDFGFAVDWMRKDLGIALAEAERNGSKPISRKWLTVTTKKCSRWAVARLDTSSLIKRLV